jgi:uncharacterized 2Fe-2S/4Fe-4S cluster protein (DUF4445 family)
MRLGARVGHDDSDQDAERDETSLTTDYGTNAEMALFYQGQVITGSTAAGPALKANR